MRDWWESDGNIFVGFDVAKHHSRDFSVATVMRKNDDGTMEVIDVIESRLQDRNFDPVVSKLRNQYLSKI